MQQWKNRGFVRDSDDDDDPDLDADSCASTQDFSTENSGPNGQPPQPKAESSQRDFEVDVRSIQSLDDALASTTQADPESKSIVSLEHLEAEATPDRQPSATPEEADYRRLTEASRSPLSPLGFNNIHDINDVLRQQFASPTERSRSISLPVTQEDSFHNNAASSKIMVLVNTSRMDISAHVASQEVQEEHTIRDERRSLRQRNPIQLHPYLLENEAYRRSLRARGLRPVNVTRETQQDTAPFEDSLNGEMGGSSQPQGSSQLAMSSSPIHESPLQATLSNHDEADSDELPAVEVLMRQRRPGELRNGFKRRKTAHVVNKGRTDRRTTPISAMDEDVISVRDTDVQDVLDSKQDANNGSTDPQHTLLTRRRRKKFKVPRTVAEDSLPTPETSSSFSRSRQSPVGVFSNPQSDGDSPQQTTLKRLHRRNETSIKSINIIESSPSSSTSEVEEHYQQKYQRRIKGVLPASWLRLDQHMQVKRAPAKVAEQCVSAIQQSPQKGVARRVNTSRKPQDVDSTPLRSRSVPADTFDSSSSEDMSIHGQRKPTHEVDLGLQDYDIRDDGDSIIEEDSIDPMLQAASHPRVSPNKPRRKRQMRVDTAFQQSRSHLPGRIPDQKRVVSHHNQSRKTNARHSGKHRKQWVRRKQPPRLGVLDAPLCVSTSETPDFVKVAKRQARAQSDSGRQNLSTKMISLHTQQDGADVDSVLRDWSAGRIQELPQRENHPTNDRLGFTSSRNGIDRSCKVASPANSMSFESDSGLANRPPRLNGSKMDTQSAACKARQTRLNLIPTIRLQGDEDPLKVVQNARSEKMRPYNNPEALQPTISDTRAGQLEQLQLEHDEQNQEHAFRRDLLNVNKRRKLRFQRQAATLAAEPIERFLADLDKEKKPEAPDQDHDQTTAKFQGDQPQNLEGAPRKRRKRRPLHVDPGQLEVHRPLHYDTSAEPSPTPSVSDIGEDKLSVHIKGFLAYGSSYSVDFGIGPLPSGIGFRPQTFIGDREFASAMALTERDLNVFAGSSDLDCAASALRLGPWSEECSAHFKASMAHAVQYLSHSSKPNTALGSSTSFEHGPTLRSLINYINKHLSFSDPIDRQMCITAIIAATRDAYEHIPPVDEISIFMQSTESYSRSLCYLLVIACQTYQLSQHQLVSAMASQAAMDLVLAIAHNLARHLLTSQRQRLFDFHDPLNIRIAREIGISDRQSQIEGIVVLYYVLERVCLPDHNFWTVVNSILSTQTPQECDDVQALETVWHTIFALLPLLEIDIKGVLKPGSRKQANSCLQLDSAIIKELLTKTFRIAELSRHPTLNAYVRVVLTRCVCLVRTWGWYKSDVLLSCTYDFFAKRGFSLLENEEGSAPAHFLERLDHEPLPHVEAPDRSFHIFLKMLANGLFEMRWVYPDKRIRNLAWRFVPNHGRAYRKDQDLRQVEYDSLRNHHDLLTVLYYASPPTMRPSLSPLRNLVDFRSSHAEVCLLGVRAWSNIVRFQLSTDDPLDALHALAQWFNDIIAGCVFQYHLARTEADEFANNGVGFFSWDVLERNVANNQRQVTDIMCDTLASLSGALRTCTNIAAARFFFQTLDRASIYKFCVNVVERSSKVLRTLVEVYAAYLELKEREPASMDGGQNSEDSQDYGGFDLQDVEDTASTSSSSIVIVNELFDWLHKTFSYSRDSDDSAIEMLIATFVKSVYQLVKCGRKDWSVCLDRAGPYSWPRLDNTDQKRRFTPVLLASIVSIDPQCLVEHGTLIFSGWLESLVERDAMLKSQHILTSALLNVGGRQKLLDNLPFTRDTTGQRYALGLNDIRQRRIALLSTILANIRSMWEDSWFMDCNRPAQQTRDGCVALLSTFMSSMKRNYKETQPSSTNRGKYVDLVQTALQLYRQYAHAILPIDKFFTESTDFPLPTVDPKYVVGHLRSFEHGKGLADEGNQKQLIMFIQSLVDRAAAEGDQDSLRQQLIAAVRDRRETRSESEPSLRGVLVGLILPAYVKASIQSVAAWRLVCPVFHAATATIADLLSAFDLGDIAALSSFLSIIQFLLAVVVDALTSIRPQVETPLAVGNHTLHLGQDLYGLASATLSFLDTAMRQDLPATKFGASDSIYRHIRWLANEHSRCPEMATTGEVLSEAIRMAQPLDRINGGCSNVSQESGSFRNSMVEFAQKELMSMIERNWQLSSGSMLRPKRDVHAGLALPQSDQRDEREKFWAAIRDFKKALEATAMAGWVDKDCGLRGARRGEDLNELLSDIIV